MELFLKHDGFYGANDRAGRIFALAALDRHRAVRRVGDDQTRICLKPHPAMVFHAGGLAGKAPDAAPRISNHKTVHGVSCFK